MFEQAIRARLIADSGVSALVGTSVYVDEAPQVTGGTDPYPYIVIQTVSSEPGHVLIGYDGLTDFRVHLDCYARTSSSSRSIANAIRNCFDGYRGTITVSGTDFVFSVVHFNNVMHTTEEGDDGASSWIRRAMVQLKGMVKESIPTLA